MIKIHTRYITDTEGKPSEVVIPVKEFKALLKHLEEMEDALELERAIKEAEELVPWEEFKKGLRKSGKVA
ncbi:MAG: hypothetical protein QMD05_06340 [Candidatus Brocadiaceae bacterium]|nr:hypothetical protein [Candidatus Brocadiaceae bacterium]